MPSAGQWSCDFQPISVLRLMTSHLRVPYVVDVPTQTHLEHMCKQLTPHFILSLIHSS